mmetsp:Transcript_45322/g.176079  ORF Transcript_45322/g.176079 Transcript_45322/m.176079 type:complete len:231 (-) Transcript_45322:2434-3126(-)
MELGQSSVTYYSMTYRSSDEKHGQPVRTNSRLLDRTIILLDWDDTILPSTVLRLHGVKQNQMSIPPGLKNGLLVLEKTVCKFITVAREYASIAIVTNSQPGWVEDSSSQFMPQVKALLLSLKVKVIYAQRCTAGVGATHDADCKTTAFYKLVREQFPNTEEVNIVSLGDGRCELDAAHKLQQKLSNARIKAVKLAPNPTLEVLSSQLSLLLRRFEDILTADRSSEIKLIR